VADEFVYAANCHCRTCRRATGSAFKPFAGIERDKLRITKGEDILTIFGDENTNDTRCKLCGSFLYSIVRDGTFVHVAMGTLVDDPTIRPTEHIFLGSKAPWFTITDDTVTTIVSHPGAGTAQQRPRPAAERSPFTRLPDGSNGVFDPGWDVSQDTDEKGALFLANYGLGTPFIEDMKLCAALGSYWPAVAPDATRTFQPAKEPQGSPWPWPTIAPLTDEEIGIQEVKGGGFFPWDGVRGPTIVKRDDEEMVQYPDINHVDYIDLPGKVTALLTARIDLEEYQRRVLAMASVYWALGIRDEDFLRRYNTEENALNRLHLAKSRWTVVSFRKLDEPDSELQSAEREIHARLEPRHLYRFHVYRAGRQVTDSQDVKKVLVEMQDQVLLYVDSVNVVLRYKGGRWLREKTILTS